MKPQEGFYIADFRNKKTGQKAQLRVHADGRVELYDALGDRSRFFECLACAFAALEEFGHTNLENARYCMPDSPEFVEHVRSEGFF